MIEPPRWSTQQFDEDRKEATSIFRKQRLEESLEAYLEVFDQYQGVFEELLETTVDLAQLSDKALQILSDDRMLDAFRYLAGPPVSTDDLKTVAEVISLNKSALGKSPEVVARIVDLITNTLDRRRFPWVTEKRSPTEAESTAAVIASAALIATQKVGTSRRNEGQKTQEQAIEDAFLAVGLQKVSRRPITTLPKAPGMGEFCGESKLGAAKADFILRLWDERVMAVECKVSNSALNSVKRLHPEAASKAEKWRKDFGETQIVPVAVISGVFKLEKLEDAQRRGLTIYWGHKLNQMTDWIQSTK